jgi:hypothetical protein
MSLANNTRLNLTGIREQMLRQPRTGVKKAFTIGADDENIPMATGDSSSGGSTSKAYIILLLGCIGVIGICVTVLPTIKTRQSRKKIDTKLRKIMRMPCVTDVNTHCSASVSGGDYVVHLGDGCKDAYEFNGIPFTDVFVDEQGNYHVPASQDMSLDIVTGCEGISATLDTYSNSNTIYATRSSMGTGNIRRIVWITKKCFKDFTLKIDGQAVLDQTPVKMIGSKTLINYSAYIYDVAGDIGGPVSVTGRGCKKPINIYTLRDQY